MSNNAIGRELSNLDPTYKVVMASSVGTAGQALIESETAADARTVISAAKSGINSDITELDAISGDIGSPASITMGSSGEIRTGTGVGNTYSMQAYDVDGTAYFNFITFTANNTPTCNLSSGVTKNGFLFNFGGNFQMAGAFDFTGTLTGSTSVTFPTSGTLATTTGTVSNADNIGITNDTTTNATMFPLWVTANTGYLPAKVTSTKLSFNPSTGTLTSTNFSGAWTGSVIDLAHGGTNANLTASNGGIFYSTATAGAILSGISSANRPLLSGATAAPTWGSFALSLGGAFTSAGAITYSGAFGFTATLTNTTAVTFPVSGTLATTTDLGSYLPLAGGTMTGDIVISTTKAIKTNTSAGNTFLHQAYDVDNTTYRTFMTLTANNTPTCDISAPSGGTLTIDGASIGSVTPGSGAFTTGSFTSTISINGSPVTLNASGLIISTLNAAETVAFGQAGYITTSGTIGKADATNAAKFPVQCLILGTATVGNPVSILLSGTATLSSWTWTPGAVNPIYLSTAGAMTQTAPSGTDNCIQKLATPISATTILFNPSPDYLTHT